MRAGARWRWARCALLVIALLGASAPFAGVAHAATAGDVRAFCDPDGEVLLGILVEVVVDEAGAIGPPSATVGGEPAEAFWLSDDPVGPGSFAVGIPVEVVRSGDLPVSLEFLVGGVPVVLDTMLPADVPCHQPLELWAEAEVRCLDHRTQRLTAELVGPDLARVEVDAVALELPVSRALPARNRVQVDLGGHLQGEAFVTFEVRVTDTGDVVTLYAFGHLQGCSEPPPGNPHERYLGPVFAEVDITRGLRYRQANDATGRPVDLRLDLYEPRGDTAASRPVLLWMHGGYFAFGSRSGPLEEQVATAFARRGYVVASVQYRLDPDNGWDEWTSVDGALANPRFVASILAGAEDAAFAVHWLREHAAAHRIDPEVVLTSGFSAGALNSLHLAYLPDDLLGARPPGRSDVQGAWSLAGTTLPTFPAAGDPPVLMLHGTEDSIVPYGHAAQVCPAAQAAGNVCELVTYQGLGHGLPEPAEQTFDLVARFFYDQVLVHHGYGPEQPAPPPPPAAAPAPAPAPTPVVAAPTFTG